MIGSLTDIDYFNLYNERQLVSCHLTDQIQPSSLDLTLSEECYEIECSFVQQHSKKKIKKFNYKKINLNQTYVRT